jgi:hypothetical protein
MVVVDHPPGGAFWHQGYAFVEYDGYEIVVFQTLEKAMVIMAKSMLSGFDVMLVELTDDDSVYYGFREVREPKTSDGRARPRRIRRTGGSG